MKKYQNYTIKEYLKVLSKKEPVPGGGSVSAMTGALGVALLSMVANYSLKKDQKASVKNRISGILKKCQAIEKRLCELSDLDARAYLKFHQSRHKSAKEKKLALNGCKKVSRETCKLCYRSVCLAPYLVEHGNKYLLSDVEAAIEILLGAFNATLKFLKET